MENKFQVVAKELNSLLGLDPAIDETLTDEEITGKIKEAVLLIEKGDKLSQDSVGVLVEMGFTEHMTACGLIKVKKARAEKAPGGVAVQKDAFGYRIGTKTSDIAADMLTGNFTMSEIKAKYNDTYYSIIRKMKECGYVVTTNESKKIIVTKG